MFIKVCFLFISHCHSYFICFSLPINIYNNVNATLGAVWGQYDVIIFSSTTTGLFSTITPYSANSIIQIWFDSNVEVHSFIPEKYWMDNFEIVKDILPQAEIYVYENLGKISGFIGLNKDYIEVE